MAGFISTPIPAASLTSNGTANGAIGVASVTGYQLGSQVSLADGSTTTPIMARIVQIDATNNLLFLRADGFNASSGWAQGSSNSYTSATGTITIASGSGVESIVINGIESHVTWGTSDAATATALIVQINANTAAYVHASSGGSGIITVTALAPGVQGDSVTMALGTTHVGMTLSGLRNGMLSGGGSSWAPPHLNENAGQYGTANDMTAWTTANTATVTQVPTFIYQNNGINGPV